MKYLYTIVAIVDDDDPAYTDRQRDVIRSMRSELRCDQVAASIRSDVPDLSVIEVTEHVTPLHLVTS